MSDDSYINSYIIDICFKAEKRKVAAAIFTFECGGEWLIQYRVRHTPKLLQRKTLQTILSDTHQAFKIMEQLNPGL